jgi:hypothetical protein
MCEQDEGPQRILTRQRFNVAPRKIRTGSGSDQPNTQLTKKCSLSRFNPNLFDVNRLAGRYHHSTRAARAGTPVRSQF